MKLFRAFAVTMKPERLRYQKNSLSHFLCLVAIIFDILSLASLMGYPPKFLPDAFCGVDVVLHIIFLMTTFMIAEKTKVYAKPWSYVAFGAAAFQISKIFIFMLHYYDMGQMKMSELWLNIVYMIVCAFLLCGAGVLCFIRSSLLQKHLKTEGQVN